MIGRTYLERGAPVVVLARWGDITAQQPAPPISFLHGSPRGGPRNVLIRRADGSEVVRPFRGLNLTADAKIERLFASNRRRRDRRKKAKAYDRAWDSQKEAQS